MNDIVTTVEPRVIDTDGVVLAGFVNFDYADGRQITRLTFHNTERVPVSAGADEPSESFVRLAGKALADAGIDFPYTLG